MDQKHKSIIRVSYVPLCEQLETDVRNVTNKLMQAGIISDYMKKDILKADHKSEALVDLITKRGPRAYDALYTAVLQSELYEAADILRPENGPHFDRAAGQDLMSEGARPGASCAEGQPDSEKPTSQKDKVDAEPDAGDSPSKDAEDPQLPDRWPSNTHNIDQVEVVKVPDDSSMADYFRVSLKPYGQTHWYNMSSKCRGRAVIFNNENFIGNKLPKRIGTDKDEKRMKTLFEGLNFTVKIHRDKTHEEMKSLLEQECTFDHKEFDCFVLVILSHGYKGHVFPTDGYYEDVGIDKQPRNGLKVNDIKQRVCAVPSLNGKPKLFFIQACRGERKQTETQADGLSSDDESVNPQENLQDAKDVMKSIDEEEKCLDETDGPKEERSHPSADYFMAFSTTSGFVSWRNSKHGTWFIQAIVYVFSKYANAFDIQKLMTLTNQLVSRGETVHGYKQAAETRSTLTKTFAFFPGRFINK